MTLSFTVLGNSGSYPTPDRPASGYLVECDGNRVWLDCGSGTLANLQRHVAPEALDGIVISHAHPDHWVDVLSYYVVVGYFRKRKNVPVWSPPLVRELVGAVHGEVAPQLTWTDLDASSRFEVGALSFSFSRTDHPGDTLAMRIEGGGRVLGYSADTGPGWSLSELGPGVDCALVEASLTKEQERTVQHLSARQAAVSAKAAGISRLVLTHLQPELDPELLRAEAEEAFGGPVELAEVNGRYDV